MPQHGWYTSRGKAGSFMESSTIKRSARSHYCKQQRQPGTSCEDNLMQHAVPGKVLCRMALG